jgi:hypothetical protein
MHELPEAAHLAFSKRTEGVACGTVLKVVTAAWNLNCFAGCCLMRIVLNRYQAA